LDFGNPGEKYELTRHNVGFMSVEKLAQKLEIEINKNKFKGFYRGGHIKR
jgi:PTH1 family peptidyl-tRNA hydrolase